MAMTDSGDDAPDHDPARARAVAAAQRANEAEGSEDVALLGMGMGMDADDDDDDDAQQDSFVDASEMQEMVSFSDRYKDSGDGGSDDGGDDGNGPDGGSASGSADAVLDSSRPDGARGAALGIPDDDSVSVQVGQSGAFAIGSGGACELTRLEVRNPLHLQPRQEWDLHLALSDPLTDASSLVWHHRPPYSTSAPTAHAQRPRHFSRAPMVAASRPSLRASPGAPGPT